LLGNKIGLLGSRKWLQQQYITKKRPISVAVWSKAWTVFGLSNTVVVCSNPTGGMDVCACFCCPVCR
jgi:hypothetical protein